MERRGVLRNIGPVVVVFCALNLFTGCLGGEGVDHYELLSSTCSSGPEIYVDPLAEHMPEIPFPNDIATVMDRSSQFTGRRINIRAFAPTVFEEDVRSHLLDLDGFGTFSPITVAFTDALDLHTVSSNVADLSDHQGNSVLLLDLGDEQPYTGSRFVPLDTVNNANFPIHIAGFPFPEQGLYFGPYEYERSPSGRKVLATFGGEVMDEQLLYSPDNREDLDGDGVAETLTIYEKETNTLILRPVIPLREATEHMVVITKDVLGKNGNSVCSPYPYVCNASQVGTLTRALPYLAQAGVQPSDIAFAWSFTTQSITPVFEGVRNGLDGEGTLAHLKEDFPARIDRVASVGIGFLEDGRNPYLLDTNLLDAILSVAVQIVPDIKGAPLRLNNVDYVVLGSFLTPNFRATEDEVFDIDLSTGEATVGTEEVPFMLSVPKTTDEHKPPFPVVLYCHGNQSIRFEALASANYLAKQGIAVMAIDAVGHGPIASLDHLPPVLGDLLGRIGFLDEVLRRGRGVDLSGDGIPDNGANFWTADTFKTRDVVRQTVIDLMFLLRILRGLDPEAVPAAPDRQPGRLPYEEAFRWLQAGDFNMDGVLDIGGPDNTYYQSGISLGGIVSSVVLGAEPGIIGGVPIVPGGGFSDVMLRSDLKDVMYRIYYEVLGPVIMGTLEAGGEAGTVSLRFQNNLREFPAGTLRTDPGGKVYGLNLANGEDKWVDVREDGQFVIGVPADVGHSIVLTSYDATGAVLDEVELVSPLKGFGLDRNTPRLRRFVGLAQITLDPADPINYAPHWFMDPLPGAPPKRVFQLSGIGDLTVPINNQIALARAGGLFGDLRTSMAEALDRNNKLIERRVMLGFKPVLNPSHPDYAVDNPDGVPFPAYDVDDIDGNNWENPDPDYFAFSCADTPDLPYCALVEEDRASGFGLFPPVPAGDGISLIRFPFAIKHEFFGIPRGEDYAIYTSYAQNQAGSFLKDQGTTWKDSYDCSIIRTASDTSLGPDAPADWKD